MTTKKGPRKRGSRKGWCFANPYNEKCEGKTTLETSHRKSKGRLGSDDKKNIDYLCFKCHWLVHNCPSIPWTRRFRTFEFQKEGETEHDFYLKHPEYYDVCFEAEYGMGYSKARQLGRSR